MLRFVSRNGDAVQGILVVVSGPSGAGKTSIVEGVIAQSGIGVRVITCTTRRPRGSEVDGKDYRFLSREEFIERLCKGEFIEHAEVYGNFYGTLAADITAAREKFSVAYLITDVQGAETMMRAYPEARNVFISISCNELRERLEKRGDAFAVIAERVNKAAAELAKSGRFAKVIQNREGCLQSAIQSFRRYVNRCHRKG